MKKIILIPDSFKGTLSSRQICQIMKKEILKYYPEAEVIEVPVADGGEGTVDAFLTAVGGEKIHCRVKDPFFHDMDSFYGILPDQTAVIEMAACAGLPLVEGRGNPGVTTTFGVGQLILDALARGCKRLVIGLGGSATNDLGMGAAAAIGVEFLNQEGRAFIPTGNCLDQIKSIDLSKARAVLQGVAITAICDINNPLYGPQGAAFVFSPQKGADQAMVRILDDQLRAAAAMIRTSLGLGIDEIPGAGAAGGMGAGMIAFFNAKLEMGIEVLLDTVQFDSMLAGADLVITGEGKVDEQTLAGKVVFGVAGRAKKRGVPVLLIAGSLPDDDQAIYESGVTAMFSINRKAEDFSISRHKSRENLSKTIDSIMRFIRMI